MIITVSFRISPSGVKIDLTLIAMFLYESGEGNPLERDDASIDMPGG